MTTNSNRPASSASEPNPPEPIQPESLEVSSSADVAQSSGQPSEAKPPIVSASQPPVKKKPSAPAANSPAAGASTVRHTTPNRVTPPKTPQKTSQKKSAQKGGVPKKAKNAQTRNTPSRNAQLRRQTRIPLFFGVGIGLSLIAGGLKAIAAALAEGYLYSLPFVGGFLRSIELSEISNLVVFALLAGGIGAATIWLPRRWNPWAKAGLLLAVSPFVFSASYVMHQRLWVQRVAQRAEISYPEAQRVTNDFLKRETGKSGFFGFYPYSTEVAELPTSRAMLEGPSVGNASQILTRELASYEDPRADLVAYIFERIGWLLRFMYMAIAGLTALIYYYKGREWAEDKQIAAYESSLSKSPTQRRP